VGGNAVGYSDAEGLEVFLCSQAAFGINNNPIEHYWIKTDSIEAGMGGTRGNEPGNDSGDLPYDTVQVTDHAGRSKQLGASCKKIDDLNESKVNQQLKIGTLLGSWHPLNQCQSFARTVIENSRKSVTPSEVIMNNISWGF
jgi:hypothetical protein